MRKKIVVTGAGGFVGSHLIRHLISSPSLEGLAMFHRRGVTISGILKRQIDLTEVRTIRECLESFSPDWIIHLAALSDANLCQIDPERSWAQNVLATRNLIDYCQKNSGCKLLMASTDLVFDGKRAPYRENDAVSPLSVYGQHKVLAEVESEVLGKRRLICRFPLVYGHVVESGTQSSLQAIWSALLSGTPYSLFTDEFRTPVFVGDICRAILRLIDIDASGIVHFPGPQRLSRYEIGGLLAAALKIKPESLRACLQREVVMSAPRPLDVSLVSTRIDSLGITFSPFEICFPEMIND